MLHFQENLRKAPESSNVFKTCTQMPKDFNVIRFLQTFLNVSDCMTEVFLQIFLKLNLHGLQSPDFICIC